MRVCETLNQMHPNCIRVVVFHSHHKFHVRSGIQENRADSLSVVYAEHVQYVGRTRTFCSTESYMLNTDSTVNRLPAGV